MLLLPFIFVFSSSFDGDGGSFLNRKSFFEMSYFYTVTLDFTKVQGSR